MFESLSTKLQGIVAKMKGKARVTDQDIKDMMREIRMALLEADVNYAVVKQFVADMSEKLKGQEIHQSLTPGQQIVKLVHSSLVDLLGSQQAKISVSPSGFTVIILYGLQGAGKTTTAAKLGRLLKADGKKPMLASVDVHRPAAAKQLEVLAEKIGVRSFIMPEEKSAVTIAKKAIEQAKYYLCDTLIVDTAGRMTVDEDMMQELIDIEKIVKPTEKLLVVDAMIGQEAVTVATAFEDAIGLDGFIMTKLDGDARGGAALSIRQITGKPIKLICVGEKVEDIEEYYPDRMANRILGMGDVMSLIEKAQQSFDEDSAQKTMERMLSNTFNMEDMLSQFEQIKKMGSIKDVIGMIPGASAKVKDQDIDDRIIDVNMAIIRSMTTKERRFPNVLNASRRKRIAAGSGTTVQQVNQLVKQYEQSSEMMKRFSKMSKGKGKSRGLGGFGKGFPF
ncbi:MAG TPA: signal recognition particle protein [Clostridiaceae bacterium]|jgi:signal recognition particle subunit SRP54|nr:signal recognition particle protein [Clostridiaceae bacterium]